MALAVDTIINVDLTSCPVEPSVGTVAGETVDRQNHETQLSRNEQNTYT